MKKTKKGEKRKMKKEELRKKLETVVAARKKAEQKEKELKLKIKEAEEKEKLHMTTSLIKRVERITGHELSISDISKLESFLASNSEAIIRFINNNHNS